MPDNTPTFQNDEPTSVDGLNREIYAEAFAKLCESCKTPLVIGLYGTWGCGKTSLIQLIEKNLDLSKVTTIYFNLWEHQLDENPAIALAHKIADSAGLKYKKEVKKLLMVIATAFGSKLLKWATDLSVFDMLKIGNKYEKEHFESEEAQLKLANHFSDLVEKARTKGNITKRLVFFIDDIDRCLPDKSLKLLEALKLFLNIEGCVFFIGVDRKALEQSIQHIYKESPVKEIEYLDKIIQLPFTIPPIKPDRMAKFIEPMLQGDLQNCRDLLINNLGDNPRQIKRFINILSLNHQLAIPLKIPEYNTQVIALLLLIQLMMPEFYRDISRQPGLLYKIKNKLDETEDLRQEYLSTNENIRTTIEQIDLPDEDTLREYIYLTEVGFITESEVSFAEIHLDDIIEKHRIWLNSNGKEGERANLKGLNLSKSNLIKMNLSKGDLRQADLSYSNLIRSNLSEADLSGANMAGVKLKWTNLTRSDMSNAMLTDVDFTSANIEGAILRGANLLGSTFTKEHLEATILDEKTIFPDGLKLAEKYEALEIGPIEGIPNQPLRGRFVLWVDDKGLAATDGLEREFQKWGAHVTIVRTTEAAMKKIQERLPDVIISDVARGSDYEAGFKMAETLRRNQLYKGPLYFYAGSRGYGRIQRASELGASIYDEPRPLLDDIREYLQIHSK
jgi:uncharacterized protein YjbI with pentapeptide repeats